MSCRKLERDREAVHSTLHQDYAVENLFDDEREIQLFCSISQDTLLLDFSWFVGNLAISEKLIERIELNVSPTSHDTWLLISTVAVEFIFQIQKL